MKLRDLILSVCSLLATQGQAGFISSNGESELSGIVCKMPAKSGAQIELQVKADSGYQHRARLVEFRSGAEPKVTYLTEVVICEESRYEDEPQIENRCKSETGSSVLKVLPHRDRLHVLISSPLVLGNQAWYDLPNENCEVVVNYLILP